MATTAKKILEFPKPAKKAPKAPPLELESHKRQVQEEVFLGYRERRDSLRHQETSISNDEAFINDFLAHAQKPFWECDEFDFDRWCRHLGRERKVAVSTQRKYQCAVRTFYNFVLKTTRFMTAIQLQFGMQVKQIATEDNCIPHVNETEVATGKSRYLSFQQLDLFFKTLDQSILEAARFGGKDLLPLLRDKAMFYLLYTNQLRISEVTEANVSSLKENPLLPELGLYGLTGVMRKGSRGSGKKYQEVPTTNPGLPPILDWYISEVRPRFTLKQKNLLEDPLFFTERGERMTYDAAYARFKLALDRAGLGGKEFYGLHVLRHTGATHEALTLSLVALQKKLGHVHLATTMKYLHIPDEYITEEVIRVVIARIEAAQRVNG